MWTESRTSELREARACCSCSNQAIQVVLSTFIIMEVRTKSIQPRLGQLQLENKRLLADLHALHRLHSQLILLAETDRKEIDRLNLARRESEEIIDGLSQQLGKSVEAMQKLTRQNQALMQQISQNKQSFEDLHRYSAPYGTSSSIGRKSSSFYSTPYSQNCDSKLAESRVEELEIRYNSVLRDKQLLQTQLSRRDCQILRLRGEIHRYQKETIAFLGLQDKLTTIQSCFQRTQANLNQQAQFYKRQLDQSKKECLMLSQQAACLQIDLKSLSEQNEQLRSQLEESKRRSQSALSEFKKLQKDFLQKEREREQLSLQAKRDALMSKQMQESERGFLQRETRSLNQQIHTLRSNCSQEIDTLSRQKDIIQNQLNDARRQSLQALQKANEQRNQLDKTNLLLREELKEANSIIRFLNNKLDRSLPPRQSVQSKGKSLKHQLSSKLQRIIEQRGTEDGVGQIVEQMLKTQTDFKNRCHQILSI